MYFKLHDVVQIYLKGFNFYAKVVESRHSLGFKSIFADNDQAISLEVLHTYKNIKVLCSIFDPTYQQLWNQLSVEKEKQLRIWRRMDAEGLNRHQSSMHEHRALQN